MTLSLQTKYSREIPGSLDPWISFGLFVEILPVQGLEHAHRPVVPGELHTLLHIWKEIFLNRMSLIVLTFSSFGICI